MTAIMVCDFDKFEDLLELVEASKLRLEDEFMQYEPTTATACNLKEELIKVIKKGIKDFYHPRLDPSFSEDGETICYVMNRRPATGKSYIWWEKTFDMVDENWHRRIGRKSEYVAYLGVLIKDLISKAGYTIAEAWNAVCVDSKEIGHYRSSKDSKQALENTGSREIFGRFDLGNTFKILAEDEDEQTGGYWSAGGCYAQYSRENAIATLYHFKDCDKSSIFALGWAVYEKIVA